MKNCVKKILFFRCKFLHFTQIFWLSPESDDLSSSLLTIFFLFLLHLRMNAQFLFFFMLLFFSKKLNYDLVVSWTSFLKDFDGKRKTLCVCFPYFITVFSLILHLFFVALSVSFALNDTGFGWFLFFECVLWSAVRRKIFCFFSKGVEHC